MAVSGAPWQFEFEKVEQRCGYLLTSGEWSDCTFMVGPETNQEAIQAHKLVLAMATPVFEAMFYGGFSEGNNPIVTISDVKAEPFRALLQYIYTGNIEICSFDMALDLWYCANKYMLPHLGRQCTSYICSIVVPGNVIKAYELARLFNNETVLDKCIQIISTNTKEVLALSTSEDMELTTLITVCSLEHLNVDSELDLFHAVARYAEVEQISAPAEGGPHSRKLLDKVSLPRVESSSGTKPAAEVHSTPPAEVVPSKPTADKDDLKEEEPSIRAAIQKLRFLTLTPAQFAEGPARSGLLTKDETLAVLMNIASRDSPVPMPAGFSECRERRQPRRDSQTKAQCFEPGSVDNTIHELRSGDPSRVQKAQRFKPGSLDHTIQALLSGDPSRVKAGAKAASTIMFSPRNTQPALNKGLLDALIPALTEGSDACKEPAARAIYWLCIYGSPVQLRVLAEGAALQPFCSLLADIRHDACFYILSGITDLLRNVQQNIKPDLIRRLRAFGLPQLLIPLRRHSDSSCREFVDDLLRTYFNNGQ